MNVTMPDGPACPGGYADILTEALNRLCGGLDEDMLAGLLARISLVRIHVGEVLYRQGEAGDCMHVVLTGRLQVRVGMPDGSERIVAHPQLGDVVGEMAVFSGSGRAATIIAVRDSMLGAISRSDIDDLVTRRPQVVFGVARMIIERLTGASAHIARRTGARNFMLVPLHRSADVGSFGRKLRQSLLRFGSVLHLDSHSAQQRFAGAAGDGYGRFLDDCENSYDFLLIESDSVPSAWTRICRGYADRVVLMADAGMEPAVTDLEKWMFEGTGSGSHHAETELVLIHRDGAAPRRTCDWLAQRKVNRHHHVRSGDDEDIARVARFLSGNATALVLAGGGARGFAHLGVIRALHEAGVVIDAVGGASFGALAATGLARGLTDAQCFDEQRVAFSRDDPLGDYTIPIISLVRGEHLNRMLHAHLPMDIEDLWLPFFAVSSDLSDNKVRVHDRGPLWRAIRASVSLPAILPPTLEDGHILVDGGMLNNLPVDVMRERMRGPIIAVDLAVGARGREHTAIPSGMDYLKSLLMHGRKSVDAPTVSRVILQVTMMASRKEVQNARKLADLYLNPPLGDYDFLDWGSMREIAEIGYRHTLPQIREWLRQHPGRESRVNYVRAWRRAVAA
ncbi:MAG: cyclic nucleotide-binding and patatin-like phospholipase domain-containing protein [Rhodocyclaceae bacterium]|nr:cyclic nucleotide-binding and patatin-like phospholipase domain-containing protein [Rhodocyclaceae bacterium]